MLFRFRKHTRAFGGSHRASLDKVLPVQNVRELNVVFLLRFGDARFDNCCTDAGKDWGDFLSERLINRTRLREVRNLRRTRDESNGGKYCVLYHRPDENVWAKRRVDAAYVF